MTVVGLSLQKSGFNIEGVRFHTGHLGPLELKISWRHLVDYVRLEMVAGPPTALQFRGLDVQQVGGTTVGSQNQDNFILSAYDIQLQQ